MMMPYHGALLKGNQDQIYKQFSKVSEIDIYYDTVPLYQV